MGLTVTNENLAAATPTSREVHPGNAADLSRFSTGVKEERGTGLKALLSEALSRDSLEDGLKLLKANKFQEAKAMLSTAHAEAQEVLVLLPKDRSAAERLEHAQFYGAYADYRLLSVESGAADRQAVSESMLQFLASHPASTHAKNALILWSQTFADSVKPDQVAQAYTKVLNTLDHAPAALKAQLPELLGDQLKIKGLALDESKDTALEAIQYYSAAANLMGYSGAAESLYLAAYAAHTHLSPTQAAAQAEKFLSKYSEHESADESRKILAGSHLALAEQHRDTAGTASGESALSERGQSLFFWEKALESAPKEWKNTEYAYQSLMSGSYFYNEQAQALGKNQEVFDLSIKRLTQLIRDHRVGLVSSQIEFTEGSPEPIFNLLLEQALDAADTLKPIRSADGKEISAREHLKRTLLDAAPAKPENN